MYFEEIIDKVEFSSSEIHIYGNQTVVRLDAVGDCCSASWFMDCDNRSVEEELVGHKIADLILYESGLDMPPSGVQDYDKNYLYHIVLDNGTTVPFILCNSSNGYYEGWIEAYEEEL